MTIIQRKQAVVQGSAFDSFLLGISGSGTIFLQGNGLVITGSWTASGDDYWRVSDQADVKSHLAFQISAQVSSGGITSPVSLTLISDSENSPPDASLQFPLYVGAHWTATTTTTSNETIYGTFFPVPMSNVTTSTTTRSYDVSGSQVLRVDAGSFDTYLVRSTAASGSSDNYYSPEVETFVKAVSYNATGVATTTLTLSSFNAWPYKSIVNVNANGKTYHPVIETDIPISHLQSDFRTLSFQVSGNDGVTGKASIWVPNNLNNTDMSVTIDGKPLSAIISENATQYHIELTFPLSTHSIKLTFSLIPSLASFLQQPWVPIAIIGAIAIVVVLIVTLLIVTRKKREPLPAVPGPQTPPAVIPPSEPPAPQPTN